MNEQKPKSLMIKLQKVLWYWGRSTIIRSWESQFNSFNAPHSDVGVTQIGLCAAAKPLIKAWLVHQLADPGLRRIAMGVQVVDNSRYGNILVLKSTVQKIMLGMIYDYYILIEVLPFECTAVI